MLFRWSEFGTNRRLNLQCLFPKLTITVESFEDPKVKVTAVAIRFEKADYLQAFAILRPDDKLPQIVAANYHFKIAPTPLGSTQEQVQTWLNGTRLGSTSDETSEWNLLVVCVRKPF